MIYNYMMIMAVLDRIRGGFIVFIRAKDKRSEGDQTGDQTIFRDTPIRSSPEHSC